MGMNSMKRTCRGRCRVRRAKSRISSSLMWRMTTMFTFTGAKPRASTVWIPRQTAAKQSTPVISATRSGRSESRLTLTLLTPAARSAPADWARSTPLVVRRTSSRPSIRVSSRMNSSTPRRTSGSPPVRRTLVMPMATATRTTRSSSS